MTENQSFVVDSDVKAEWAIKKIREEQAEHDRFVAVCQEMIEEYKLKIETAGKKLESDTAFFKSQLASYFVTVEKKCSKTQESYKLPSGTLVLKHQKPELQRDEGKLVKFVKELGLNDYIKTKESVDWAELKQTLTVAGDKCLTADGEVVEGVTVVNRSSVFEVKI